MDDFIDDEPDALGSEIGSVVGSEVDSEIEHGDDMLHSHRIQSRVPIMTKSFEDSVSQLATSDDDTVYKDIEKEIKEVDSGESTKEIESGDSDSTWSYSLRSAGSGNSDSGKERNDGGLAVSGNSPMV
eukprot:scaffold32878_cov166-Skeletonema_menzelii.AAC.1